MKKIYLLLAIVFALSVKGQEIVPLSTGPIGPNKYLKDLENVRANFVGTWQYTDGNKEFILHIYNWDMKSQGSWWGQGEYWMDVVIGNYIYKENGVEIINTTPYLTDLNNITEVPFFGQIYSDESLLHWYSTAIKDYGIQEIDSDCEPYYKSSYLSFRILNLGSGNPLQADFDLAGNPKRMILNQSPCLVRVPGYTIPKKMILTKISDTPPPLD